jgi:hypothetical protein
MRRVLFALAAVIASAGTAAACINDSELPSHEREFRSTYKNGSPPQAQPESSGYTVPVAIGGGLFLLAGAAFVTLRRPTVRD